MECTRCKQPRRVESFHFKDKLNNTRNAWCKFCVRDYTREHYSKNADRYKRRAREHQRRCRALVREVIEQAKSKPCADCQQCFPVCVMDFDHREGAVKVLTIGASSTKVRTLAAVECIKAEIAKYDVVCSNCHRIRTHITRPACVEARRTRLVSGGAGLESPAGLSTGGNGGRNG